MAITNHWRTTTSCDFFILSNAVLRGFALFDNQWSGKTLTKASWKHNQAMWRGRTPTSRTAYKQTLISETTRLPPTKKCKENLATWSRQAPINTNSTNANYNDVSSSRHRRVVVACLSIVCALAPCCNAIHQSCSASLVSKQNYTKMSKHDTKWYKPKRSVPGFYCLCKKNQLDVCEVFFCVFSSI